MLEPHMVSAKSICLFTCAFSRTIHLEVVPDLTADSFLQVFRTFAGRRSVPKLLISDNGSTFHGSR